MNAWLKSKDSTKVAEAIAKMLAATDRTTVDMRDYAGNDNEFALWLCLANARVQRVTGLSILDIEDWNWRDAYDDDMSPASAARDAVSDTVDMY